MAGASSKGILPVYQLLTAASMTTTVTSAATSIKYTDDCAIQLNFTGAPVGTFQVQGSLDYTENSNHQPVNAGNWIPLTLSPVPVAAGSSGQILLDLYGLSFPWIRVVYIPTSGTGSLDAFISAKSI